MYKRFLVIQTASLGDVILSTPVLEKIHYYFPEANIDFLLKYGYEDIFKDHPFIHRLIVWDKSEKKYSHLVKLIKVVRDSNYDVVVNVQRFASSGLITALSKAGLKVGFSKNPFSVFFSKRIKHKIGDGKENPHEIKRNLKLIESITGSGNFPIKLYPSQYNFAKVSQYKTKQYITIAPASIWFTKQYPEEKWVDFATQIEEDIVIYLIGSPSEKDLCQRIIDNSKHRNSLNLAGKLSFLESAALMKDALMNFVNDSAPMHMASAVNAKTTAIFCSTVPEFGFGPLSEHSFIIQAHDNPECKPCGLHGFKKCPEKHFDCANNIKTTQLLEVL
jgi:heptosyltransferase-2